jgi:hypothetical protein
MSHPRVYNHPQSPEGQGFLQDWMKATGNFLGGIDDGYSKFLREQVGGVKDENISDISKLEGFDSNRALVGQFIGAKHNQTMFDPSDERYNKTLDNILRASVVGGRYVVPAAGVTGAGYGLIAIANQFGGKADEPTDSQLYM